MPAFIRGVFMTHAPVRHPFGRLRREERLSCRSFMTHTLVRLAMKNGTPAVLSVGVAAALVLSGCASSGKPVAAAVEDKPVTVTVEAPMAEKDALGNYRFLMQQEGKNMSADQFDAWMKANGIRVARGNTPEGAAAAPAAKN